MAGAVTVTVRVSQSLAVAIASLAACFASCALGGGPASDSAASAFALASSSSVASWMLCSFFIVACRFACTLFLLLLGGPWPPGCRMPSNMMLYRSIFTSGISTSMRLLPGGGTNGMGGGARMGIGAEMSDFLTDLVDPLRWTGCAFCTFCVLGVLASLGGLGAEGSTAGSVCDRTTVGAAFLAFLPAVVLLLPTSSCFTSPDAVRGRAAPAGAGATSGVCTSLSLDVFFLPSSPNSLHLLAFLTGTGPDGSSSSHGGLFSIPRSCGCQFPPFCACAGEGKPGLPSAIPIGAAGFVPAIESGVCVRTVTVGAGDPVRGLPCGDGGVPRMGM